MTIRYLLSACLILGLAGLNGCDRNEQVRSGADDAAPVARVGDETITLDEARRYLEARLSVSGAAVGTETAERYLEELILARSLAHEARRLGLDRRPAVRLKLDQLLAAELIEREVVEPVLAREIGADEIAAYYERHRSQYVRPEQVRLADIFIAAPLDGDPAERREKRAEAESLLGDAMAAADRRNGFAELVRSRSDRHPLYENGDTGFFDARGEPSGLDPALVAAAFSLERKGVVHDRLVETPLGFHVVMLVGRRAAMERDLEEVAGEIGQRIRRAELDRRKDEFITAVVDRTKTDVYEDELQRMQAELQRREEARTAERKAVAARADPGANSPPLVKTGETE